ncbi:MAG: ExbD/TolR family protein [Flavobacteriales bacterium]
MSKFKKSGKRKGGGGISTASLPDIIFILLFFFMVVTVMRETKRKVKVRMPKASEVTKLEKKSLVDYVYVGPPKNKKYGTAPRIQLDDSFARLKDLQGWVKKNRRNRPEDLKPLITTSLKVDKKTKMGIVSDIKQELRKARALKINYSTNLRSKENFQ